MKAQNQIVAKKSSEEVSGFSNIVNSPGWRRMIDRTVGDPQRAAALVSTLISVVNASDRLRKCNPAGIISAALRGEIGMGLSVALGEYSIVPYRNGTDENGREIYIAQFQLGANGLKRLCVRSGEYRKIRLREVRDGEFCGYDEDGDAVIRWGRDQEDRDSVPIIGYYGSYELMNGFKQSIYWTHTQILRYADRYSRAFSLADYNDLLAGKITGWKADKLRNGSPWYAAPDELPHIKMCLKTIAKQLLSDGLAPKEVMQAIRIDDEEERNPGSVVLENEALPLVSAGFGNDVTPALPTETVVVEAELPTETAKKETAAKATSRKKAAASEQPAKADVSTSDYTELFPPETDDPFFL